MRSQEKGSGAPLRGRCDPFVVETVVHYPTDVSLLWDAMRCPSREPGRAAEHPHDQGWRTYSPSLIVSVLKELAADAYEGAATCA